MALAQKIQVAADPHSEMQKPWHFLKAPRSVVGTQAAIARPAHAHMLDWEAELAVVIGRLAKNVTERDALEHVAGYTIGNDLSARDAMSRTSLSPTSPFRFDWLSQKSFDGACPLGPWLVPAKQIPNPQGLGIKLWVNDVLKQDSNTSKMIFSIAEQIAFLSTRITLYPGDVILTGTPAGVGMARGDYLKRGDVVRVWVERIGTLVNTMA
jgi:2-keto-4-pentenoate hydratase/2-oxohepta-3-ene-1,7-dioic acid hydratase in catechol pathway